jgi:toxin ParE1/3/4
VSVLAAVLPEARQDVLDGRTFFEGRRPGSGRAFAAEVPAALDRIGDMPELYGEVWSGVRAAGVKRFGYVVYYRIKPGEVEVVAVLHGGRDPRV